MKANNNTLTISFETIASILASIKKSGSEEAYRSHLTTLRSLLDNESLLKILDLEDKIINA